MNFHRLTVVGVSSLISVAVQADNDPFDKCKSPMVAPPALVSQINNQREKMKPKTELANRYFTKALENAKVAWTCSRETAAIALLCCRQIPVELTADRDGCYVTLPYGQLNVKTGGAARPTLIWRLVWDDDSIDGDFAFGMPGIELIPDQGGKPAPVDRPDYDHHKRRFKYRNIGVMGDQVGHQPAAYPADKIGDSKAKCTDYDPLIINTD